MSHIQPEANEIFKGSLNAAVESVDGAVRGSESKWLDERRFASGRGDRRFRDKVCPLLTIL